MACESARGTPSREMSANTRRVSSTFGGNGNRPAAIGFVPRKSYRSHPSTPSSRSAAWMSGRVAGLSMGLEGFPVGAPFARPFAAAGAANVVHGTDAADHEPQQL